MSKTLQSSWRGFGFGGVKKGFKVDGLRFRSKLERVPLQGRAGEMAVKAREESAERRERARARAADVQPGKVEIKKSPKPNADGLSHYFQTRNSKGHFNPKSWISETLARSLGWEE